MQRAHQPLYLELHQSSSGLPSHFLKIHVDIILPSTPSSSNWFLSLKSPHQNPSCTTPVPHTWHMPRPPGHPNNIWCGIQIIMVLVIQSSPFPCLVPLRPTRFPQHCQPMFLPQRERPSFTPTQKKKLGFRTPWSCGPGSVVRIMTAHGLDGPGIECRWGEIFRICSDRP